MLACKGIFTTKTKVFYLYFQTQKSKIGGFQKMAENNAKKYIIKVRGEEVP